MTGGPVTGTLYCNFSRVTPRQASISSSIIPMIRVSWLSYLASTVTVPTLESTPNLIRSPVLYTLRSTAD